MVAYGKFFPTFCYRNPNFVIIFTPHRSVNHDRNYLIMFILGVVMAQEMLEKEVF